MRAFVVSRWNMFDPLAVLLVGGTAFSISVIAGELLRRVCVRWGIFDHPNTERWHRTPRPRLGGIAVYAALVSTVFMACSTASGLFVLLSFVICCS